MMMTNKTPIDLLSKDLIKKDSILFFFTKQIQYLFKRDKNFFMQGGLY